MRIVDPLRPQVTIKATPDEFRFMSKIMDIRARTLIRLDDQERKIINIGEPALDNSEGGTLIRLFDRPSRPRTGWFDGYAFTMFCKYHLLLVTQWGWLINPVVHFEGLEHFRTAFDGREAEVLAPPLRAANVARLHFRAVAPAT